MFDEQAVSYLTYFLNPQEYTDHVHRILLSALGKLKKERKEKDLVLLRKSPFSFRITSGQMRGKINAHSAAQTG